MDGAPLTPNLHVPLADHRLGRFLSSRGVSLSCAECRRDDVVVSEPHEGGIPVVTNVQPRPSPHITTTPVYLTFCRNCAALRMYDRSLVNSAPA